MSNPNAAAAIRWFDEVWNQRRAEAVRELLAPDAVGHMEGRRIVGPEEFLSVHAEMLQLMPDLKIEIEGVVAEGDDAVVRWAGSALNGQLAFRGMTWFRFREGKIIEGWDRWNHSAFVQRLQTLLPVS